MIISSPNASSPIGGDISTTDDPVASNAAKADRRFAELLAASDDAKKTLAEITKGGAKSYWDWKMKELRKQIAEKVMKEMNLTPEKIAQMSAKERVETENKIMQIVEQQVRLAIAEEMKRRQHGTLAANASLQSVIDATQNIALTRVS